MRHFRLISPAFLLIALFASLGGVAAQDVGVCPDPTVGTSIGAIQGSGATFALGGTQTIDGIVTADFENDGDPATTDLRGFYVQDGGDGDPATSDGIFVQTGASERFVSVGDRVQVTGTVAEQPTRGDSETQLATNAAGIAICSTDNPLPAPVEVTLPFAAAAGDTDARERYEGMLVAFPQTLTVTELYQLGRHSQLTLSSGGRLPQPTNVALPGDAANAVEQANLLNQIVIDDAYLTEDPDPIIFPPPELTATNTVRGGYAVTGVTGIFTQSRGRTTNSGNTTIAYRVRVITPPTFDSTPNPRPTAAPSVRDASLTVASANLLNYFNSFSITPSGCFLDGHLSASYCRGANNQLEFDRQRAKTTHALALLNADIVGLVEIENDLGNDQALADLVAGVNDLLGADTYQYLDTGRIGGDAIRVGFIYKPAKVAPVGDFATLEYLYPFDTNTRPPLAQLWRENASGEQFYVVANHLKSKGSCPAGLHDVNADQGDGQDCWNADRLLAANEIADWITTESYFAADPDVLLIGDFNAYAQEDPIRAFADAGYADTVAQFIGDDAYSYAFDAQWGYIDSALATASLIPQITGVAELHINADEPSALDYNLDYKDERLIDLLYSPDPYRAADHDPLLIGLNLGGA